MWSANFIQTSAEAKYPESDVGKHIYSISKEKFWSSLIEQMDYGHYPMYGITFPLGILDCANAEQQKTKFGGRIAFHMDWMFRSRHKSIKIDLRNQTCRKKSYVSDTITFCDAGGGM